MSFWKKHKKKIIITSIVIVVGVVTYILVRSIKRKNQREEAKRRAEQAAKDRLDPNKTTFVNEDGKTVSKDADKTTQQINQEIRQDAYYQKAYNSPEITEKAITIDNAHGWFNDDEQGVYNALMNLDRYTLLALQDRLANDYDMPSLHMYLKGFMSPEEYDKSVNYMVQARNRLTKNMSLTSVTVTTS